MPKRKIKNVGTKFEDFLQEEKILAEVEALALKKVISWQLQREMESQKITKEAMAKRMKTSRSAVERLLGPSNSALILKNLERAALAVKK